MTSLKNPAPLDFKTQFGLALDERDDEIVVDLFAGGAGASTGLEIGLGRQVAVAINHNPAAISMHTANHPHSTHYQSDVWEVDQVKAIAGRKIGWMHASPDCTHHSQAAGGQPRKKEIRDLSWVVIKWAGKVRPRVISLENVKQIRQWGPLIAKRDKVTGRVVRTATSSSMDTMGDVSPSATRCTCAGTVSAPGRWRQSPAPTIPGEWPTPKLLQPNHLTRPASLPDADGREGEQNQ